MFSKFFRSSAPVAPTAAVPAGQRVYAVGDVHGRLDLLDDLLERIGADDRDRPDAHVTIVFLGDLIDRGPDSKGVVDRLIELFRVAPECHLLLGNHEEVLLAALEGDAEALRLFARIGGRETALSYGISEDEYEVANFDELLEMLRARVPAAHLDFFAAAENLITIGDYAFVHAGVRPGVPFGEQRVNDLRWIRREFLDHRRRLEKLVVHGHTVAPEVMVLPHRIGLDTGAYQSGRLSAMGLEGAERWLLQTDGPRELG